jgi:phage gp29-like protein
MTDAIVIADVYPIDSSRIQYKLEDNYRCVPMISQGTNESAEIPPYQMVIHRHYQARIDNPYGVGIGGLLIELIEWRNALLDLWLILSKKYVEPVKIGKVPDTASDEEVDAFFDQLNKLRNSSTFVLPVGFEIDFQTASASEFQSILLPLLEYCDQKINGLIIGESIVGKDISNANQHRDGVAAEITEDMAKSMAQEICDTLNETVVQWLLANNFDEPVEAKLVVVDSEDVDAGLERLKMLKDLGLQIDQDWLAEKYNVKRAPIKKTLGNI